LLAAVLFKHNCSSLAHFIAHVSSHDKKTLQELPGDSFVCPKLKTRARKHKVKEIPS